MCMGHVDLATILLTCLLSPSSVAAFVDRPAVYLKKSSFVAPKAGYRQCPLVAPIANMALDTINALKFCQTSPSAVIATVWPIAESQAAQARVWLVESGASILLEKQVEISLSAAVPTIMALYHGEEWLETNCWYDESPLPQGPPSPPYPGAKWKAALTFLEDPSSLVPMMDKGTHKTSRLTVLVADASKAPSLWSGKYGIRERMRRSVGALGNACLHITDNQERPLAEWQRMRGASGSMTKTRGRGFECSSSYAFHCARVLLNPHSVSFLNACCDVEMEQFCPRFAAYTAWLEDPKFDDVDPSVTEPESEENLLKAFRKPPFLQ